MKDTLPSDHTSFFYCYDRGLATWLKHMKGIDYNCTGYHIRTKDQFWQFTHSQKMSDSLIEYNRMLQSTKVIATI
jgi:hypothetical protein